MCKTFSRCVFCRPHVQTTTNQARQNTRQVALRSFRAISNINTWKNTQISVPDSDITGNVVRSFHVDMTQPWHTNHPFICGGLGCYQGHPSASLEGRCSNGPSRVVRRSVGANSQKKAKVEAEERPRGWVVWTFRFLLVGLGWLLWCQRLLFSLLREWDNRWKCVCPNVSCWMHQQSCGLRSTMSSATS